MMATLLRAYLIGFGLLAGGALGALGLAIIHNLTGGAWGRAIRGQLEAAMRTIPLLALLFVPIALGASELYPWARPEAAHDHVIAKKAAYLNLTGFVARTAFYFACWIALARLGSRAADAARAKRLAAPSLIVYVLTMTFASFDWLLSLDPKFASSIFGIRFIVGAFLTALAFIVAYVCRRGEVPKEPLGDLGALLLGFSMVWAYLTFCQLLIVWSVNLPEEVGWYLRRVGGGWRVVTGLVVVLQASIFFVLLPRRMRTDAVWLGRLAVVVLVMRYLELVVLVVPEFTPGRMGLGFFDLALPAALAYGWGALVHRGSGAWSPTTTTT